MKLTTSFQLSTKRSFFTVFLMCILAFTIFGCTPIEIPPVTPTVIFDPRALYCQTGIYVGFEDLMAGSQYGNGKTLIQTDDVKIITGEFESSTGRVYVDHAEVVSHKAAAGFGQELKMNNIRLLFQFREQGNELGLLFQEKGGEVNIEANGKAVITDNFADVNNTDIGGAMVSVTNGHGDDQSEIKLIGKIDEFAIGGQELWIDSICLK